ncbi:flagellar basal body-associated protein FliL [Halomonas alkalisoli]|uniref:flagellar basal body-associated protein FliL n=1 Tax=Halomonas alkalisoli TaxID=2907158 RepID=UPI001F217621|nr:flagellar basal body-associated protein FliL [Halomonas alkalisoli]MCE9682795.1 flagellar basal body-associated protein FliL [Halomonas alkalisoli]
MAKTTDGSSKLLWLMILLVMMSTVAAGVAIYLVMNDRSNGLGNMQEQQLERKAPIFLKIDPFTVNLTDDDFGSRLLYIGMSLKVGDEETREILDEHMPQVRSRLLMLFSGKQASQLTSPEGKRRLSEEVIAVLSAPPLTEPQPPLDIRDVLFTEFIVQ